MDLLALVRTLSIERDELREERDNLRAQLELRDRALDATETHFMITDGQQPPVTVYVNRALAFDHGYEPQALLGKTPDFLVPGELNPGVSAEIERTLHGAASTPIKLRSRRKDGSWFWAGVTATPIYDGAGRVTHSVIVGADITAKLRREEEQRRLQDELYAQMQERERMGVELRLAQKLEAVGRLAAGIAHEINTPIQFIGDSVSFLHSAVSDLEILLELYRDAVRELATATSALPARQALEQAEEHVDLSFLRDEIPKSFERALEGVERVAGIVRAMKEFAHPDSAEQSGADLNHAIRTTLTVAHNEYKYHAQVETHFGELPQVVCNVGELNQVFLNLIINATHAIQDAGKDAYDGRIMISTQGSREEVLICIADNGCGIPNENVDKIFDPFFTTKEPGRGTGQGLAIARSIVVDKHGGAIDVESAVGTGTRFTLRLPIAGKNSARVKRSAVDEAP